jgi:hypothetical protein
VPPAVALLNYITIREALTLSRIFSKLGFFAEFSLDIKNIAERINAAALSEGRAAPQFCVLMSLKGRVRTLHKA